MTPDGKPRLSLVSSRDRTPPQSQPLRVTPFYELYNRATKEPEWLVEPLIPKGATFCLNGQGGIWKSWTMTAMGVSIAASPHFLGKFKCPQYTSVGNSVLFMQLEETGDEAASKAQMIARGMGLTPQQIQDLGFSYVVDQPFRVDNKEKIDRLKFIIDEFQPDLVIWDNARKMKLGNANDSEWADAIAYALKELQTVYPSAHGLIHHWRKKSPDKVLNDPDQMASGTAALRDAMAIWLPVEHETGSEFVTLHHTKMRRGKKIGSFNYKVRVVDSEGMAYLEYIGAASKEVQEDSVAAAALRILKTDPQRVWTQPEIVGRLQNSFSERQVKYAVKYLHGENLINVEPSKGGRPTLLRIRTPMNLEQSSLEKDYDEPEATGQPDTTGQSDLSGSNVLPKGDL
jgi:hypothetical protein